LLLSLSSESRWPSGLTTADLNRLWDGLSKPAGLEQTTIETFFDLDFVALPAYTC
jgi:hypothetical protein